MTTSKMMTAAAIGATVLMTSGALGGDKIGRLTERRMVNGPTSAPIPSDAPGSHASDQTAWGPSSAERPASAGERTDSGDTNGDPSPWTGPDELPDGPITLPPAPPPPPPPTPPAMDFNGDDRVDILDLTFFLDGFFAYDTRADLNGDGRIDAFDLVDAIARFDAALL